MERMRGEVRDVAGIADWTLYLTECDGLAASRRSLRGALVKYKAGGDSHHVPTHDGATRATRRSSAEALRVRKSSRLLLSYSHVYCN
jgi:hypothetical protein